LKSRSHKKGRKDMQLDRNNAYDEAMLQGVGPTLPRATG
jgi:hypothetical protein